MLTSHTRSYGAPPKELWEFSAQFQKDFRLAKQGNGLQLTTDPSKGKVTWKVESDTEHAKSNQ